MAGVEPPEIPVVWFTESETWEPTANKLARNRDGALIKLDRAETARRGGGLVRIGVAAISAPHPYRDLAKVAHAQASTIRALTKAARAQGSLIGLWYFSIEPVVDTEWVTIEVFEESGWHSIATRDGA